ncbi:MAG: DNA polymerase III subunit gamma/tau, partial [Chitinophagaceae bacterium]|nr:DNA polymerase III subunit gamma/tau [Chitinophagaceae bacterium]
LDKIVSFTNGELTYQNTLEHLNILDADYYFKLTDCMLEQNLSGALLLYDDINKKGFEGDLVLNGYAEFLRNLLICKDDKVAALLEVVESFREKYKSMAAMVSLGYIISALNVLNEAEMSYRTARNKRLHVELTLIKLCYLQQALEFSAGDSGITKKKLVESAKPLAFRNFSLVEVKEIRANTKLTGHTKVEERPKLIIESALAPALQETAVSIKATKSKLSGLNKIREKLAGGSGPSGETVVKVLNLQELKECWATFCEKLKTERNPALKSLELAELQVTGESSFEATTGNNLEQKFIEQQRLPLTEHLQAWFNNRMLTYTLTIEEKANRLEKLEMPLSSREQYHKMVAEYPLIKELRDRLRLELDY